MVIKQYDISTFNLNEKIEFFEAFYNYLSASIPVNTALFQMLEYTGNLKIKNVLRLIMKEVDGGNNFADVILKFKKPLGGVYCNLISVGVQTGELPAILKDINDILNKQRIFKSNIIKSCTYPAFLLLMLIGSFILFAFFIQPSLARMQEMATGGTSAVVCPWQYLNLLALFVVGIFVIFLLWQIFKQALVSERGLNLPVIGPAVRYYNLSSFSRLLAISYKAGIPITQAIMLSADAIPNKFMSGILIRTSAQVTKIPIAKAFSSTRFFVPDLIMKIESGDMSGNLDKVFYEISETINLKLETAITSALKLLEPILMMLIGCVVGYYAYTLMSTVYGSLLNF